MICLPVLWYKLDDDKAGHFCVFIQILKSLILLGDYLVK